MSTRETPLEISFLEVSKYFRLGMWKKKVALENVNFSIEPGQVVGLLGPNGSGKSTTLKLLIGFLQPTTGNILIGGTQASEIRCRRWVGYLPENPRFQKFLTGREVLKYYGSLLGMRGAALTQRVDKLLELVGLRTAGGERTRGYSKGMVQRLAMAQALLGSPRLLILDEPMSGLDPIGRIEMRALIREIHEQMPEATLFFSTHILSDVEQVCSSVILLKSGKLTRHCSIDELLGKERPSYEVLVKGMPAEIEKRYQQKGMVRTSPLGISITIHSVDQLIAGLAELKQGGASIVGLFSRRFSLEESLFGDPRNHPALFDNLKERAL